MEIGPQSTEEITKDHMCGSNMEYQETDRPFELSDRTIVILKDLPVLQCDTCGEYAIEDPVMEKVDPLFGKVNQTVELEIVQFAA